MPSTLAWRHPLVQRGPGPAHGEHTDPRHEGSCYGPQRPQDAEPRDISRPLTHPPQGSRTAPHLDLRHVHSFCFKSGWLACTSSEPTSFWRSREARARPPFRPRFEQVCGYRLPGHRQFQQTIQGWCTDMKPILVPQSVQRHLNSILRILFLLALELKSR